MRVATWNVNSVTVRLPKLSSGSSTRPPTSCACRSQGPAEAFPHEAIGALGYEAAATPTGAGTASPWSRGSGSTTSCPGSSASRRTTGRRAPGPDADLRRGRRDRVYVPNGREPDHPHYAYKLEWLDALRSTVAAEAAAATALRRARRLQRRPDRRRRVGPRRVRRPDPRDRAGAGRPRRAASGWASAVLPRPLKQDHPFTYWDYRGGDFHKDLGMRIDLVCANAAFAAAVTDT